MRNFQLIATAVDVLPLMHAVQIREDLWNENTLRTKHPESPHGEVDDIWLRFQELVEGESGEGLLNKCLDENESVWYPASNVLHQAKPLIFDLMRRVEGTRLGRVMITRLKPGAKISAHVDSGSHARYYERYHVVLQGLPGSIFWCGEEKVNMRTGEVWWFDNEVEHCVVNNSADDRVHMIVDIAP